MLYWPRRTVLASLIGAVALALPGGVGVRAQPATPETDAATPGAKRGELLPRDTMLSLAAVQEVMPKIASESATGENASAIGTPAATRSVTFDSADGTRHLVLSVDKYARVEDAAVAFEQAAAMSEQVPGATGEEVSDLGEGAFIGVVTQGDETHVGGGALWRPDRRRDLAELRRHRREQSHRDRTPPAPGRPG